MKRTAFPNPEPHPEVRDPEQAPLARRLHCRTYNHCLKIADAEKWDSFHCNACRAFTPLGAEQGLADAGRLAETVSEAYRRINARNLKHRYYTTRKGTPCP